MSETLTEERLAELERLCEQASDGPWQWARCYELGDGKHWALETPEGAANGYVMDHLLVLWTRQKTEWIGDYEEQVPLSELPNFRFIAEARTALPALLLALRQARRERDEALAAAGVSEGTPQDVIHAAVSLNDGSEEAQRVFRHVIEQGRRVQEAESALLALMAERDRLREALQRILIDVEPHPGIRLIATIARLALGLPVRGMSDEQARAALSSMRIMDLDTALREQAQESEGEWARARLERDQYREALEKISTRTEYGDNIQRECGLLTAGDIARRALSGPTREGETP